MATFSVSANELKYASGSSWSSGKARQGVYSSTRYEGAINFAGLTDIDFSNIAISQIQLRVTFGPAGGDSTKRLTLYKATKNAISGSVASMRGDSIGYLNVSQAYDRTTTLTFNASANAGIFNTLRDYFAAGNRVLILYVPSTRGTYSGGFCYDYLSVTAATLTFTFEYLQSTGSMVSTSVAAGSTARLNITAYNSAYTHKVTWKFGSHSVTQNVAAGNTFASYTIPLSWLDVIPNATSGVASATLETLDASGVLLGSSSYSFTVTVPASVSPSISSIFVSPVNDNAAISDWGIYVYGKSKAQMTIFGAAGAYGSTIKSYSIVTTPNVGSSATSSFKTNVIYATGTITVTAKVVDSRGCTASKSTTFNVYDYGAPYFSGIESYRCNSAGARDDVSGTYAHVKVIFGCSVLDGRNAVACKLSMEQIGGSYSTSATLTSGTEVILGAGKISVDASYNIGLTLTDTAGMVSTYNLTIPSAAYVMHVKNGGKAVGFGTAAGNDETISFGWPVKLKRPLEVSQGGTGANTAANALNALGGMPKSGGTFTGNVNFNEGQVSRKRVMVDKGDGVSATVSTGAEPKMASMYLSVNGQWTNALTLYEDKSTLTKSLDIGSGGTGAKTAEQARKNLGIQGNGVVWEKGRLASAGSGENAIKFANEHADTPTMVLAYQNSGTTGAGYKITNVSNNGFSLTSERTGIAWVWVALWLS